MKFNKKNIAIITLLFLFITFSITYAESTYEESSPDSTLNEDVEPSIQGEGAILIDANTGKVLYAKNIDKHFYPASTTKILTALLAIENGDIDDVVTVSQEANLVQRDGTIAGLDLNEEIKLEKLIYGLMLPSGNDAANTIAVYVARKVTGNPDMPINEAIEYFCDMMNARAKVAGAKDSHFSNPHGYHKDDHFTTPYDMAMIAREAMKYEFLQEVVSTHMYTMEDWNGVNKEEPTKKEIRYWRNTNLLIDKNNKKYYYPYATGIKTGYTSAAGQCLVSSATKGDLDLIAVVFKSTKECKWTDSIELFEYGFNNFISYQFVKEGDIIGKTKILNYDDENDGSINLIAQKGYKNIIKKSDMKNIEKRVTVQPNIEAPVKKGQVVGQVSYYLNDDLLFCTDLVSDRNIHKKTLLNIVSYDGSESNLENNSGKDILLILIIVFGLFLIFMVLKNEKKNRHIFYKR